MRVMTMQWRGKLFYLIAAALLLAAPAHAQFGQRLRQRLAQPQAQFGDVYGFYEGELHFEKGVDPTCSALTNGTYKVYFATHKNAGGVEALMFGEQILHAYIKGSDVNHLGVTYLGDSAPSRTMKLKAIGSTFLGLMQSKTLVSELYGRCTTSNSEFKVSLTNRDGQSAFQTYAEQFKLDVSSEQDLVLAGKGHINEALPRLRQAFAEKAKQFSATHPQMLRYYYYLALAYDQAGMWPFASYWYDKAATVCTQSFGTDNACQPLTLFKLGQSLAANGKLSEGEADIRRALQVADRVFGPNAPATWLAVNALAQVMIASGRYAEAGPIVDQAMTLAQRAPGADLNVAAVKVTYATLYRQTGQLQLAEDTLQQAIALDQKVQGAESTQSIVPRVGLATLMSVSGKDAQAEPIAKNALDAAVRVLGPELPDHPALATARIGLGNIYTGLGKYRDAEPLYRQATENSKKFLGPDHPNVAVAELSWAKMLLLSGREQEALPLLRDAYRISHLSPNQGLRWRVPAELMEVYGAGKTASPVLAIFYGKESVNELQSVRGNLARAGSATQQSFASSTEVKSIYTRLAQLLLADHRIPEAQQVLAMVSAEEMDQFLQQSVLADATDTPAVSSDSAPARGADSTVSNSPASSKATPDAPRKAKAAAQAPTEVAMSKSELQLADLNADQIKFAQQYDELNKKQQEQGEDFSEADKATLKNLTTKLDDLSDKFQKAQDKIAKTSKDPEAIKARREEMTGFSTAFKGTLINMGHGAVVAEYFMLPDEVDIILTTPNTSFVAISPIKKKDLNKKIQAFRLALGDSKKDPVPLAKSLYKDLIQPIASSLEAAHAETLMLALHDSLRYVPFAALNDGKGYLIERMAVVNVDQASRDKLNTLPKSDPWAVWGLGVTQKGPDYPALEYAREELNNIKATLGGKSQIKLDKDFTETVLRSGLGTGFQVVHIASHFEFSPGSIDKTVLLLGDGSRMSLGEIGKKLDFTGVELLTLSACETAVGDDSLTDEGSEVEGLAQVAQGKGAMAVIATLWPVADESTATLMNALYQAHQSGHLDKAQALQTAQLTLLRGNSGAAAPAGGEEHRGLARKEGSSADNAAPAASIAASGPRYAHPFYWAPFILMGNWL